MILRTLALLIAMCMVASCGSKDDLSVTVEDEEDNYTFSAHYPKARTSEVIEYLSKAVKPDKLFHTYTEDFDITTVMKDGTVMTVTSSPGDLKLKLDKTKNSPASYARAKRIGDGVRSIFIKR